MSYHFAAGSRVWIEEGDAYSQGTVVSVTAETANIKLDSGKTSDISVHKVLPANLDSIDGAPDLLNLEYLHDAGVMQSLKTRFGKDEIYTWAGSILVTLNPFKRLPIMGPKFMEKYKNCYLSDEAIEPHVYVVADRAYGHMTDKYPQSVLISGESGAGKTEAAKAVLDYVTLQGSVGGDASSKNLQERIMSSNPILEAFGNAKTIRNDNSSRFGKYIQLNFKGKQVNGADTIQYLLEKIRVVKQQEGERNYHAFYQLLAGLQPNEKAEFELMQPKDYWYLKQSGTFTVPNVDDKQEWNDVVKAWNSLGFPLEQQVSIKRLLAAILHLGNVNFKSGDKEDSKIENPAIVIRVARLLSLDESKLQQSLCFRSIVVGGNSVQKPLLPDQAKAARDSLAKSLYSSLFSWIVENINRCIAVGVDSSASNAYLGILDIFGFEVFTVNSFEQLCINYCNEKLQQHFNSYVFKAEQVEYDREKVPTSKIVFQDNQACLELLEKKPTGIFPIVDDVGKTPKATDTILTDRLHDTHAKHPNYQKPKVAKEEFTVVHFAGSVAYSASGFLDKNMDTLNDDLRSAVSASADPLLQEMYAGSGSVEVQAGAKKQAVPSTGMQFRSQLDDLMEKLNATSPHFIKCIKSCNVKKPDTWEHPTICRQLRFSGVLEATRIRRTGFAVRLKYEHFSERYYLCVPGASAAEDAKDLAARILSSCSKEEYALGVTKVFLKDKLASAIEAKRTTIRHKAILELQRLTKPMINRILMDKMLAGAVVVSAACKRKCANLAWIDKLQNLTLQDQELLDAVEYVPRTPTPPPGESAAEKAEKAKMMISQRPALLQLFGDAGPESIDQVVEILIQQLDASYELIKQRPDLAKVAASMHEPLPSAVVGALLKEIDSVGEALNNKPEIAQLSGVGTKPVGQVVNRFLVESEKMQSSSAKTAKSNFDGQVQQLSQQIQNIKNDNNAAIQAAIKRSELFSNNNNNNNNNNNPTSLSNNFTSTADVINALISESDSALALVKKRPDLQFIVGSNPADVINKAIREIDAAAELVLARPELCSAVDIDADDHQHNFVGHKPTELVSVLLKEIDTAVRCATDKPEIAMLVGSQQQQKVSSVVEALILEIQRSSDLIAHRNDIVERLGLDRSHRPSEIIADLLRQIDKSKDQEALSDRQVLEMRLKWMDAAVEYQRKEMEFAAATQAMEDKLRSQSMLLEQKEEELGEMMELIEALDQELAIKDRQILEWQQRHASSFSDWQNHTDALKKQIRIQDEQLIMQGNGRASLEKENQSLRETIVRLQVTGMSCLLSTMATPQDPANSSFRDNSSYFSAETDNSWSQKDNIDWIAKVSVASKAAAIEGNYNNESFASSPRPSFITHSPSDIMRGLNATPDYYISSESNPTSPQQNDVSFGGGGRRSMFQQ